MYFPLFYLQLDANLHGINPTFAFYSVRFFLLCVDIILELQQLVILNASSFVGRASSGFYLSLGIGKIVVATTACCTILIFSMAGISGVASVVVIAVIYGYSVGVCKYFNSCGDFLSPHVTRHCHGEPTVGGPCRQYI